MSDHEPADSAHASELSVSDAASTPSEGNGASAPEPPVLDTTEPPAPESEPAAAPSLPELSWGRALRGGVLAGLLFALFGAILEFYDVARSAVPHILSPGRDVDFLELEDGLPIPRLLDWNLTSLEWLHTIGNLRGLTALLAAVALFIPLWLLTVRVLNPTFRLLRPRAGTDAAFDGVSIGKALRLLATVGLMVCAVWIVTMRFERVPGQFAAVRWLVLGVALWVGYSYRGLAGNFASPLTGDLGGELPKLILWGGVFGACLFALGKWASPRPIEEILARMEMLGTFHRGYWSLTAWRYILGVGAIWFCSGALLFAFGRPALRPAQRAALCLLTALGIGVALWSQRPFTPSAMAQRWDITPEVLKTLPPRNPRFGPAARVPNGAEVAKLLVKKLGLPLGNRPAMPERSAVVFTRQGVVNVRLNGYSEDGLTASAESAAKAEAFLKQRNYETAYSWELLKHLHNTALLNFDATRAMQVLLDSQERYPHQLRTGSALRAALYTCAATPENLALLDAYADATRYAHRDRPAVRLIGDLYTRMGKPEKALEWYRKAEMPKSFLAKVQTQKPMFNTGRVKGVLKYNGRPIVGARVGIVPVRLNGLSLDMEIAVLNAAQEIVETPYPTELFGEFYPRPWNLRWISAGTTTDANGAFQLDHLTEGEYRLVCALPANLKFTPLIDPRLTVPNAPRILHLFYAKPEYDLGALDFKVAP